jgi:hypothetical protein
LTGAVQRLKTLRYKGSSRIRITNAPFLSLPPALSLSLSFLLSPLVAALAVEVEWCNRRTLGKSGVPKKAGMVIPGGELVRNRWGLVRPRAGMGVSPGQWGTLRDRPWCSSFTTWCKTFTTPCTICTLSIRCGRNSLRMPMEAGNRRSTPVQPDQSGGGKPTP